MSLPVSPGIFAAIKCAFWFSLSSVLVKSLGDRLPVEEIVLGRAVVGLVLCMYLLRGSGASSLGVNRKLLLLRGLLGFVGLYCMFSAFVHLPLADAVVLFYVNPVFAALLGFFLLGERFGAKSASCVALSLTGVMLVARPSFLFGAGEQLDPHYVAVALLGAVASACVYVLMRRLSRDEHPMVIVLYLYLVTAPLALLLSLPHWIWPQGIEWLMLVGIGTATQFAQVNLTKALTLEPVGRATATGNVQVVFAACWGVLIFGEIPDPLRLTGAACVIAGTVLLALQHDSLAEERRRP